MNTLMFENRPIWEILTYDPYNYIGEYVIADGRRTKYVTRCRWGNNLNFEEIRPIEPQPITIQELIDE